MRIKLYSHKGCMNCAKVKAMLERILPDYGIDYPKAVLELDIDDAAVLTELLMMNTESVPVLVLGGSSLSGTSVLDEGRIRDLLTLNLEALRQPAG